MTAKIFTDGSCHFNGDKTRACAGIGVYWPGLQQNNISEPLYFGHQTNQRAEIVAVLRGIKQAYLLGYKELEVYSDSDYVVQAANDWMYTWERKGWVGIDNKSDFKKLLRLLDRYYTSRRQMVVRFYHVPRELNVDADWLANEGAVKRRILSETIWNTGRVCSLN